MAYVPGFKWDLFISYPMEAQSWTKQFVDDLRKALPLSAVKDLEIYFASRNWQLGETSDAMLDAARSSALFLAVLTRDALAESETRFLQREMEAFRESGSLKDRFCPIPLYPIDGRRLSKAVPVGNSTFWNTNLEFFYLEDNIPVPLSPGFETAQYEKTVFKAAHQLRELLEKIRGAAADTPASAGPFTGMTVCLAVNAPNSSIETEWQEVRRLLVNDGVAVIPNPSPNADPAKIEADVEAAVQNADLFVQLFSAFDRLDGVKAQFTKAQRKAPKDGRCFAILQWRKKHPAAEMDSLMLKGLSEDDRKFCEGETVQTGLLEDFKVAIREKLEEQIKQPPTAPVKPLLYITADISDWRFARELQKEARKYTVAVVMGEGEAQKLQDFEGSLTQASGVVFLHGNATPQFVSNWMNQFACRIRKLELDLKFAKTKWLYLAPPEKTEEEEPLVPFEDLRTEGSQKEFTVQGIKRICAELCGDPH
jgi:hypothetical protein